MMFKLVIIVMGLYWKEITVLSARNIVGNVLLLLDVINVAKDGFLNRMDNAYPSKFSMMSKLS